MSLRDIRKMKIETKYQQAVAYKKKGNYDLSWEIFKELLEQDEKSNFAEVVYEASIVLKRLGRIAQAGMYLRKALQLCELQEKNKDWYLMAKINIHLENEKASLFYLNKAIDLDQKYRNLACVETVFKNLQNNQQFIKLTQTLKKRSIRPLKNRGKKIAYKDMSPKQQKAYQIFLKLLSQNAWKTDDFSEAFENNLKISPQAVAEYDQNPTLNFKIAYYVDISLMYLKLQNTEDREDEQAYLFYTEENITEFLATLISYQNKLNPNNWEAFLESIIPTCEEVAFEMPDGRQVKIS